LKVALDAQLTIGTATGIGEYVRGLLGALRAAKCDAIELSDPRIDPWRFDRRVFWDQVVLPHRARASGADIVHCASGTMPLSLKQPSVVTVHDVAWLRVQAHARPYARYYFGRFSVERYRQAQRIVVDSRFSRDELLSLAHGLRADRVEVVYPGVASDYCTLERRGGDGRTILVVGTVERRKNLDLLIRALPALPDARIVAVGPSTPYAEECSALARQLEVDDRIEMRGYVTRDELLELYATSAVVAVPSIYEGFGYAAAQALCAGTPVIVSDRSALPEIVGTDAPVVPINDLSAWLRALRDALEGGLDQRAAAVRAGAVERLTWTASARQMIAIYEKALAGE
jgi:alpha-1,3-rhamnosyl/mannosyltransferase